VQHGTAFQASGFLRRKPDAIAWSKIT
jgi:hypothetical protein